MGKSIPILERVELPGELIPADSRVEIDAKITAGELLSAIVSVNGCTERLLQDTSPLALVSLPRNSNPFREGCGRSKSVNSNYLANNSLNLLHSIDH